MKNSTIPFIDLPLNRYTDALKTRKSGESTQIWDLTRKTWLVMTPEEMVRQLLIQYFVQECSLSVQRMVTERSLDAIYPSLRYDLAYYDRQGNPLMLCECKAFGVALNDKAIFQLCQYNRVMQVPYLLWTNGPQTCLARKHEEREQYLFCQDATELRLMLKSLI